ncbi:MAG TPA: extracellular solute-binding protein [Mobilitalea sp.]|nr:extracellular solute-binding protein [Mobilitalea sp.]
MKSKQFIRLIVCLGVILTAFLLYIYSDFIWGDDSGKKDTDQIVSVWTIHGDTEETLRKVLKRYEQNNPNIVFDITVYKNEVYQAAISNALMTNDLPDMFFWWGFSKLERLVDMGIAYDMTHALEKKRINTEIIEGGLDAFTFDNKTYALPLYGWAATLFCNRHIFEENNLKYPKNYDQFLETVAILQEKGVTPLITSVKESWVSSLYYMSLVQGEETGKNIFNVAKDNTLFSTPQFSAAAHKLYNLVEQKPWQDNYLESDAYNAAYSFTQGEGAMLYYGSWATPLIEGESSLIPNDVDVIPFPNGNGTEGIGGFVDTFIINKDGIIPNNTDLIDMYIDVMYETSEITINDIGGGIPVYRDQSIDAQRFPLLYEIWEINKYKTLYPAYDQILSEELSSRYYQSVLEIMAGDINHEKFIENLSIQ